MQRRAQFFEPLIALELHRLDFLELFPEPFHLAPTQGALLTHPVFAFRQNGEFLVLRQEFDPNAFAGGLPGQPGPFLFVLRQPPARRAHQVAHGRIARAHLFQHLLGRDAPIHDPNPLGLPVLFFYFLEKVGQGLLVLGVARQHFIGDRKTLRRDDQGDDHLNAIRTLVPAVTVAAFGACGKRRMAFKVRARQIVEQHFVAGMEQILPALRQVREQWALLRQQMVVALVELMDLRQLLVRAQQVRHGTRLKPMAIQAPLAARIQQPIGNQNLQHPIPPRALATGREMLAQNRSRPNCSHNSQANQQAPHCRGRSSDSWLKRMRTMSASSTGPTRSSGNSATVRGRGCPSSKISIVCARLLADNR